MSILLHDTFLLEPQPKQGRTRRLFVKGVLGWRVPQKRGETDLEFLLDTGASEGIFPKRVWSSSPPACIGDYPLPKGRKTVTEGMIITSENRRTLMMVGIGGWQWTYRYAQIAICLFDNVKGGEMFPLRRAKLLDKIVRTEIINGERKVVSISEPEDDEDILPPIIGYDTIFDHCMLITGYPVESRGTANFLVTNENILENLSTAFQQAIHRKLDMGNTR